MGKAPAFQFYVKDWLSDPQLRMASFQTKGIWIDILCLMWESNDRGKLTGTIQEFCKMLGATEEEFTGFLIEAKRLNFASVTKSNNESNAEVTLENRRMVRDEKARKNNALRQSRFKSNAKSNTKVTHEVTPPSSTASSSPSSNNNNKPLISPLKIPDWVSEDIFSEYQKARSKKLKPASFNKFFSKLKRLSEQSKVTPEEILNQSIENGWDGIFAIKEATHGNNGYGNRTGTGKPYTQAGNDGNKTTEYCDFEAI
jgi:hypothetical protein